MTLFVACVLAACLGIIGVIRTARGKNLLPARVTAAPQRVADPQQTFSQLAQLGFDVEDGRLKAGDAYVDLEQGETEETERPLLNHLGLRVESADDHIREAEERGLEIADVVDAANTYAVFVWGPDGIKLEYVEHKPTFSLV